MIPERLYKYIVGKKGLEISRTVDAGSCCFLPKVQIHFWNALCKNASKLNNLHEKFDFVFTDKELDELENIYLALVNWIRVLNPGGHVIARVKNNDNLTRDPNSKIWTFCLTGGDIKEKHFNLKKNIPILRKINFNIIEIFKEQNYIWLIARKKSKIKQAKL